MNIQIIVTVSVSVNWWVGCSYKMTSAVYYHILYYKLCSKHEYVTELEQCEKCLGF